ncbi:unnamed protein product [Caenorhabditis bovis]|uniref:Uncharacterized protein n=1 Tax=Caenorhabditis bovis TaxID=2654633 RepID=A0A8S1F7J8_9PELO|nr:unnamed protein product [Caenorhabditis bovis]
MEHHYKSFSKKSIQEKLQQLAQVDPIFRKNFEFVISSLQKISKIPSVDRVDLTENVSSSRNSPLFDQSRTDESNHSDSSASEENRSLTEDEAFALVDEFYYGKEKFRENYPFYTEGIVMRSTNFRNKIHIYTSRIGRIMIDDSETRKSKNYCFLLVEKPNKFKAIDFSETPKTVISTKFLRNENLEVRAYALLGWGDSNSEGTDWIAWNDTLGLMKCLKGAARINKKKFDSWTVSCDPVSVISVFENGKWIVRKISALTSIETIKNNALPQDAFFSSAELTEVEYNFRYVLRADIGINIIVDRKYFARDEQFSLGNRYEGIFVPAFSDKGRKRIYTGIAFLREFEWEKDPHLNGIKQHCMKNTARVFDIDLNNINVPLDDQTTKICNEETIQAEYTTNITYNQIVEPRIGRRPFGL